VPTIISRTIRALLAAAALLAGAVLGMGPIARAATPHDWEYQSYRIHLTLVADSAIRPRSGFEGAVGRAVAERVAATIGPLWSFELEMPQDPATRSFCRDPRDLTWNKLPRKMQEFDKLMWLSISAAPEGFHFRCREFDAYTQRWGPLHQRTVQQRSFVGETAFQMVRAAFSPLAVVRPIPDNDKEVDLAFRGSSLPRLTSEKLFVNPGDAYLPLLRRTDRGGKLLEKGGITEIPYTLLTAAREGKEGWLATIHSGMRGPFASKRRGLVEQLAVGLRNERGATRVRFHARTDEKQGLAGYEVFRDVAGASPQLVGVTDRKGEITIPPGDGAVSMVLLRSEGTMLARVPVVAGAPDLLDFPVADDPVRLAAQSEARVFREELIDVVARRTIMMARVRTMLKGGKVDDARKLMSELDDLPTASTFSGAIDATARRLPKSSDPQVQRAVDRLFASTRELLSKFLDPRAITALQSEVNSAKSEGS
jgi:hypothetical protein